MRSKKAAAARIDVDAERDMEKDESNRLKKRDYMRNLMRQYRSEEKKEVGVLKMQITELQAELARRKHVIAATLPPPSQRALLIPWKDVATALRDERQDVEFEHRSLKVRAKELKTLVHLMKQWVSANVTRSALDGVPTSWQNVSLQTNPHSRILGKEWITKHMYHNTDRMFARFVYPDITSTKEFYDFDFEATETHLQYYHRRQYVVDVPMAFMLSAYKQHLCSVLMMDWFGFKEKTTLKEMSGNTTLHQLLTPEDDEWMNLVTGEFHEENGRCVFVIQQIEDDEAAPMDKPQRKRMIWLDMRPLPNGKTKVRVLYKFTQIVKPTGFVSIDEEAADWGCDLHQVADEKKEDMFRQYGVKMLTTLNANHQRKMNDYLTRMMTASPL
ncbi:Aste57867_14226 [Aphanomyces stellatus]|uniref:Aste57867_14226 protein n=1 Tax=Aphanomyces stellatus TaxID=120398 RepID=A0A485L2C9_9STRA|nr:hypothetical protein As57867_014175 [Aphanomyces stellatus]VFT91051.1 Aste57867_14226 [Aphanomyces stellatus]